MQVWEIVNDSFAQPLGSVPNIPCAFATKRSPNRKASPGSAAAKKLKRPVKPKSSVQPVASKRSNRRKSNA